RLKQIAIPILSKETIDTITQKIKTAFELKANKKKLIDSVLDELNAEYEKYFHYFIQIQNQFDKTKD
ncbi:MAG: hypothetical protein LBP85_08425, partial [Prevotellaceae bacterium]|nr:hypothetical protein [Prevotellaceae bacterium]